MSLTSHQIATSVVIGSPNPYPIVSELWLRKKDTDFGYYRGLTFSLFIATERRK